MAKKSSVVRNDRRKKIVARFATVRKELKEIIRKLLLFLVQEREEAILKNSENFQEIPIQLELKKSLCADWAPTHEYTTNLVQPLKAKRKSTCW